jgi:hypothetical protein
VGRAEPRRCRRRGASAQQVNLSQYLYSLRRITQ